MLLIIFLTKVYCKLKLCNSSETNVVCFENRNYQPTLEPQMPTNVNLTFCIHDILEVNENEKTITMSFKLLLEWFDKRLSVNRSKHYGYTIVKVCNLSSCQFCLLVYLST